MDLIVCLTGHDSMAHCWLLLVREEEGEEGRKKEGTWSRPWLMVEGATSRKREGGKSRGILSIAQCWTLQPVLYAAEEGVCTWGVGVGLDAAGEEGLAWGGQIEFWPGWDALICVRAGGGDQQAFSEDGRRCGSGAGKRASSQVRAEVGVAERQRGTLGQMAAEAIGRPFSPPHILFSLYPLFSARIPTLSPSFGSHRHPFFLLSLSYFICRIKVFVLETAGPQCHLSCFPFSL